MAGEVIYDYNLSMSSARPLLVSRSALLVAVGVTVGCGVQPVVDGPTSPSTAEALVRTQFNLPVAASLAGLSATAAPAAASVLPAALTRYLAGPSSNAHLRVVASFELPLSAVEPDFWSSWQPLPLPPAIFALNEPPVELAGLAGYYRCDVHAWSPSSSDGWAAGSCAEPPANFDSYQVAVYDPQAGRLTVVLKRYY